MLLSKRTDRVFVGISNVTAKTFKCRLVEIIEYNYPLVGNVVMDIAPHEINKAMKLL